MRRGALPRSFSAPIRPSVTASPFFARFYKSDLQMQTPLEPHWREPGTKLLQSDSDARKIDVARLYLRRCHAVGLEVLGITDHNFGPSADASFIAYLRSENNNIATELGRAPLIIFPGFEIEANVGKGCHVLCLFAPDASLADVHDRLTALGLPGNQRFDSGGKPTQLNKSLTDILDAVQDGSSSAGLVIAAHPLETKGLFDNSGISGWLQQEEFTNPKLLCLEVPKPVAKMHENWQTLLGAGPKCLEEWRRKRPIACVMSSDCYRLDADESAPGNSIGYRYSWIRMTVPSMESLRQAFLDHESRIRLQDSSPDEEYRQPRVVRVRVAGARFLRRLEEVRWSRNMHCVIGSRGTGKSTLIDYIRAALDRMRPGDLPETLADEVSQRVRDTLPTEAMVEVEIETHGGRYRIEYQNLNGGTRSVFPDGAQAPDPQLDVRSLFPCRFLSQREIDHSVGRRDREAMRQFLDQFVHRELSRLQPAEQEHVGRINEIEAMLKARRANQTRRPQIETERHDLLARLQRGESVRAALPAWRAADADHAYVSDVAAGCSSISESVHSVVAQITALRTKFEETQPKGSVNTQVLGRVQASADDALTALQRELTTALSAFDAAAVEEESELASLRRDEWQPVYNAALEAFYAAGAGDGGADVGALSALSQQLSSLEQELAKLDLEQHETALLEQERAARIQQLRQTWCEQSNVRQTKANELMNRLRTSAERNPLVVIRVEHQSDRASLLQVLSECLRDRRRLTDDDLKAIVQSIAADEPTEDDRGKRLLDLFVSHVRRRSKTIAAALTGRRGDALYEAFDEAVLRQLETRRVQDSVTYLVYRHDGTLAGPIERVSAGQQGTAILNMLLADGEEPLLIDTPEEGLDSEGVYTELVPLFRREKERRQIIVVTHNANLPVCADAEGIVAFEAAGFVPDEPLTVALARSGATADKSQRENLAERIRWKDWEPRVRRTAENKLSLDAGAVEQLVTEIGRSREAESRLLRIPFPGGGEPVACGALDVEVVQRAVQDIMEGSREAFERRGEKYGF